MRTDYASGISKAEISRRYNISVQAASNAVDPNLAESSWRWLK